MVDVPTTRYVKTSDGVHIAHQTWGEGPSDILYSVGLWWHLEYQWTQPSGPRFLGRLGQIGRVIAFDKRGTGLSDRLDVGRLPTLAQRVEDLRAVLDAVESKRAVLLGIGHGADLALAFAAMHPERTQALVVLGGYARLVRCDDHPWGLTEEQAAAALDRMELHWDEPQAMDRLTTGAPVDSSRIEWWTTMQRLAVSPGGAAALWRTALATDLRPLLGEIRAPTLIAHRSDDRLIESGCGRYLADHIPGAEWLELPGPNDAFDLNVELLEALERLVTGRAALADPDRVLATVVFTDIVGSTSRVAQEGDRAWRDVLDQHDWLVDRALERHGGRKVNPTGDGMLATFDSPGRAVRCALTIRDSLAEVGVAVRAGVHTGEVEVRGEDVGGVAVHIGARVAALAGPGEVLVSRTVADLLEGSDVVLEDHGEHELKGVPGARQVFAVLA